MEGTSSLVTSSMTITPTPLLSPALTCRKRSRKRWLGLHSPVGLRAQTREVCVSLYLWGLNMGAGAYDLGRWV